MSHVEARLSQRHYLLLLLGEFLDELHKRCETNDERRDAVLLGLIRGGLDTMFAAVPDYGQSPATAELRECLDVIAVRAESGKLTKDDARRYEEAFLKFREAQQARTE